LETGVIAGGIISAAMLALVTALAARLSGDGQPLLVGLVYPPADAVPTTILVTQLVPHRRLRDRRSAGLMGVCSSSPWSPCPCRWA
jgi:hypothetical protein